MTTGIASLAAVDAEGDGLHLHEAIMHASWGLAAGSEVLTGV
jgi:hypothetical protein